MYPWLYPWLHGSHWQCPGQYPWLQGLALVHAAACCEGLRPWSWCLACGGLNARLAMPKPLRVPLFSVLPCLYRRRLAFVLER
jgi:hypothetical protein